MDRSGSRRRDEKEGIVLRPSRPSNREEAPFYTPRGPSERAGKGVQRERNSDPLRGGLKLGTCAADAKKRIFRTGNKPTEFNGIMVVAWPWPADAGSRKRKKPLFEEEEEGEGRG